jgi:uncharacterized damage-inducible protein DinB
MMNRTLESTLLHVARTRLVHEFAGQINACLDALDEADLWWRPNEQANAAGNLVLHLAGSNRHYIGHIIAGRADERNRDAEFAARGTQSKAQVRDTWNDSVKLVDDVLGGLDPARLMETTDRGGKTTTYVQALLHVLGHVGVHLGQIVYITKQRKPGALDEIWMKMRSR